MEQNFRSIDRAGLWGIIAKWSTGHERARTPRVGL